VVDRCTFAARLDGRAPTKGDRLAVNVDGRALLFFDPETTAAIEV
jgi:hypothetical protein